MVYVGVSEDPGEELSLLRSAVPGEPEDRSCVWLPGSSAWVLAKTTLPPEGRIILGGASLDIRSAEAALEWLCACWEEQRPGLVLFPVSVLGHELAARMSARLGLPCYPEVRNLRRQGPAFLGRKKVCGSNMEWEFTVEPLAIVTVSRCKAVSPQGTPGGGIIENRPLNTSALPQWLLRYETLEPYRANPLETAPLIFAAGRGLGSAAACERLGGIAARYRAPLGFSRPAALNGWGGIEEIIGQSGIRTQAEVCVAVGVSGAAAFMAGLESVKRLIAVNADRNAPIFHYADLGILASADAFIAAMEEVSLQNSPAG